MSLNRNLLIDVLKAIFIICVIIDHSHILNEKNILYILFVRMAVPGFLIISGYVYSKSAEKKSLKDQYSFGLVEKRIMRFTIPIIVTYCIYLLVHLIACRNLFSFKEIVSHFILADYGMGAYYWAILIQFIFIFPIIYHLVNKYSTKGLIIVGTANFIFEIIAPYFIAPQYYRLLIFRYLLHIAWGVWIYLYRKVNFKFLFFSFFIGIIYLLLPDYFFYSYRIFTTSWAGTSMMASFYIMPIMYLLLKYIKIKEVSSWKSAAIIGRASYHIMCMQMIFFYLKSFVSVDSSILLCLSGLLISIPMGIAFYCLDNMLLIKYYK